MLTYLRGVQGHETAYPCQAPDRKLRLFTVACCRQVWDGVICDMCEGKGWFWTAKGPEPAWKDECLDCHGTGRVGGLTDPRSRRAVEVAERYAEGEVTEQERQSADEKSAFAFTDRTISDRPPSPLMAATNICGWPNDVYSSVNWVRYWLKGAVSLTVQAALLRDIFGNPWQPIQFRHDDQQRTGQTRWRDWQRITAWHDHTVPRIAQAIYDDRAFGEMLVLADALEDAGCTDVAILSHCRGAERVGVPTGWYRCDECKIRYQHPGRCCDGKERVAIVESRAIQSCHARGCWVLDLLLGKE